MKHAKKILVRIVPVLIIAIVTIFLSYATFTKMVDREEKKCWNDLKSEAEWVVESMKARFKDSINFLDVVADTVVMKSQLEGDKAVLGYLNTVRNKTIFERIDILLPDDVLLQNGKRINVKDKDLKPFSELAEMGEHISTRRVDKLTGKDVIYCFNPIEEDGEVLGILIGAIDCKILSELFPIHIYDGEVQVFLINRLDGNYIIDEWHEEYVNIQDLGVRELVDGSGTVDFAPLIMNGETGTVAYYSKTNGEPSYMYYMPVDEYNWEICLVVQENSVFAQVNELRKELLIFAIIELVFLLGYIIWILVITISSVRNGEKIKQLEAEEAINKAKSRFLTTMSHDIRTPLNGIIGMLDIIKRHKDDSECVQDCLNKIDVSAHYLVTLVNDVLDINEIENGKFELVNEPIDIRKLLEQLNIMVKPRAKEMHVFYTVECGKLEHPYVLGSSVHIHRILINLITNAIKYNQQNGEVCVSVEELRVEKGYGYYDFRVNDTGIGMSEEFQKSMFNAFEQEKVDARSKYQGYGLGLTIVRQLVDKMQGTIEVESHKGIGTSFHIILKLELDETHGSCQDNISTENENSGLSGTNILLVEDNELNMEIAEIILTDLGANVVKAVNGKNGVDVFAKTKPYEIDLILMDIMMPELDGCEATKQIRKLDRPDAESVPIIAMTASTFTEEIQRCFDSGMNEHLSKPLNIDIMIAKISKYLNKRKG